MTDATQKLIEAAQDAVEMLRKDGNRYTASHLESALAAARQEVEQAPEDAARYRWLRDHSVPPHNFYLSVPVEFDGVRYARSDVDAYIDAAMRESARKDSHE